MSFLKVSGACLLGLGVKPVLDAFAQAVLLAAIQVDGQGYQGNGHQGHVGQSDARPKLHARPQGTNL